MRRSLARWLTSLPAKIIEGLLGVGALAVLLAIVHHHHVHVPAWMAVGALAVAAVLGAAIALILRGGGRARQLRAHAHDLHDEIDLAAYYALHVSQILDHLQQVLAGALPGVTVGEFIDRGILGPARDMLMLPAKEDVRLSVLVPDGECFRMPYAAGHRLPSQRKFELKIDESMARFALYDGEARYWPDVTAEAQYRRHPRGERPWRTMVSLPIKVGDTVVGVLNALSTDTDAFTVQDRLYMEQLASIISVVASATVQKHGSFPSADADMTAPRLGTGSEEGR